MPINIVQGNNAQFTVEFLDSNGLVTIPPTGIVTITYTSITGSTASFILTLTQVGSFFTGIWPTSSAALGFANWVASTTGLSNAASGTLRIIDP